MEYGKHIPKAHSINLVSYASHTSAHNSFTSDLMIPSIPYPNIHEMDGIKVSKSQPQQNSAKQYHKMTAPVIRWFTTIGARMCGVCLFFVKFDLDLF